MKQRARILLLGSTGYLGRTLTTLLQADHHVLPTYRTSARFAGSYRYDYWTDDLRPLIEQHQINMVIIAANMAYATANPAYSLAFFQQRAELLMRACHSCRVIYISSDAIFAGKEGHYKENDFPFPMTPYGKHLRCLERLVQDFCRDYCIIRPSYLYGYSLSQLDPRLSQARTRLLAGEQLTYFSDMIKSPMEVNQVAQAISMLATSQYIGIVHVAGAAISIYDFYREAMNGLGVPIAGLHPGEMPADFPYPKDTSLDNTLMKELTGIEPLPVHLALSRSWHEP